MIKPPCGECPDNGCGNHSNRDRYLEYAEQCEQVRKKNFDRCMVDGYTVGEVIKSKRSSRRYGKR